MDKDVEDILKGINSNAIHTPQIEKVELVTTLNEAASRSEMKKDNIIPIRLTEEMLKRIDEYARNNGNMDRSKCIRELINRGLDGKA